MKCVPCSPSQGQANDKFIQSAISSKETLIILGLLGIYRHSTVKKSENDVFRKAVLHKFPRVNGPSPRLIFWFNAHKNISNQANLTQLVSSLPNNVCCQLHFRVV